MKTIKYEIYQKRYNGETDMMGYKYYRQTGVLEKYRDKDINLLNHLFYTLIQNSICVDYRFDSKCTVDIKTTEIDNKHITFANITVKGGALKNKVVLITEEEES